MNRERFTLEISKILDANRTFDKIYNSNILIIGASGMLGSCLVDLLIQLNKRYNANIKIYALSRNEKYLKERFAYYNNEKLKIVAQDICNPLCIEETIDYIIHGGSNADPYMINNNPVDTIKANFIGMDNLLNFYNKNNVKRLLYISSGEMYGLLDEKHENFSEEYVGYLDYSSPRSSYPSGKRATEVLCQSYVSQYDNDIVIARPCHVYGPTMKENDSRAICQFIRNAADKEDIILKSDGKLERSHCYVLDSVIALLYILIFGKKGEAYNISDEASQCTIKDLAEKVAEKASVSVIFDIPSKEEKASFSKVNKAVLNNKKLKTLGWNAIIGLDEGIKNTIEHIKYSNNIV
ncbi:NAD(P)-dependent oxidoreductase [Clostridium botulinum]|uniref:NAD-dependent epimerase/dehydratase family protein n=1 Tax=Clostridium botulinum TaxID=1491 RepID=UPI0013F00484|nr:NAD(P)-dependent oxidoreductase [Clostridium botulinum]NFO33680.1 NAD(P)-dependent oxidoreductase [Clostridium botulinum]NFO47510.1 NAD(P)-dependent oxidoreductase [Clostridium botulinum]NFS10799.1 NAD(P)-dependent oxidoreductase [Clostridium botulinum]